MMQTREQQIREFVFRYFPSLQLILGHAEGITFHQDKFAANLANNELVYLGALVKVAGLSGVDITFTGTCGEDTSGDNSKEGPSNKAEFGDKS